MDISKEAREAIAAVYGSEAELLKTVAQTAKDGDHRALKLIMSYAYGTPVRNTEVTLVEHTDEPMVPVSEMKLWIDQFTDPKGYQEYVEDINTQHAEWGERKGVNKAPIL